MLWKSVIKGAIIAIKPPLTSKVISILEPCVAQVHVCLINCEHTDQGLNKAGKHFVPVNINKASYRTEFEGALFSILESLSEEGKNDSLHSLWFSQGQAAGLYILVAVDLQ